MLSKYMKFCLLVIIFVSLDEISGQMIPISQWLYGQPYPNHHFLVNDKIRRNGHTYENQEFESNPQNIPPQSLNQFQSNFWPYLALQQNYRPLPQPVYSNSAPFQLNIDRSLPISLNANNFHNNHENQRLANNQQIVGKDISNQQLRGRINKDMRDRQPFNQLTHNNNERQSYIYTQVMAPTVHTNMEFERKSPHLITFQPLLAFDRITQPIDSQSFGPNVPIAPFYSSTNPTPSLIIRNDFDNNTNKRFNEINEFERSPIFYAPWKTVRK